MSHGEGEAAHSSISSVEIETREHENLVILVSLFRFATFFNLEINHCGKKITNDPLFTRRSPNAVRNDSS